MRHYEIVFMVHPDQQSKVPQLIENSKTTISEDGGKVHRLEDWGRRDLAYPINGHKQAHYVLMNVETSLVALKKLEDSFRLSEDVFRTLVVRNTQAETGQSYVVLQQNQANQSTDGRTSRPPRPAPVEKPQAPEPEPESTTNEKETTDGGT